MISPFNYFCRQILPLVYDDTLSYYECLCKVTSKLNDVIALTNLTATGLTDLKNYVDTYFADLNIQNMVNAAIDNLVADGTITNLVVNNVTPMQTNFKTDKFVFMGDSYAFYPDEKTSWLGTFTNLAKINSNNYYNLCVRGSGFVLNSWTDILKQNLDKITDKNNITKFIICGGANDTGQTYDAVYACAKSLIDIIRANFPNAEIHLFGVGNSMSYTKRAALNATYEIYNRLINIGYIYHPIYNGMHFTNHFDAGGLHPNANGALALGNLIYQHLYGAKYITIIANSISPTASTYNCITDGLNISIQNAFFRINNVTPNTSKNTYSYTLAADISNKNYPILPIPYSGAINFYEPTILTCATATENPNINSDKIVLTKCYIDDTTNQLNAVVYNISQNYDVLKCLPSNNIINTVI